MHGVSKPVTEPTARTRDWLWSVPNVAVGVFAIAMLALVWGLQSRETALETDALARDVQWAEQTMRLHLQSNQEFVLQLVRDYADGGLDATTFQIRASQHIANNPELESIALLDGAGIVRRAAPFETTEWIVGEPLAGQRHAAFAQARESGRPAYGEPHADTGNEAAIDLFVPAQRGRETLGMFVATYSVPGILRHLVPNWFGEKYRLAIIGSDARVLAANSAAQGSNDVIAAIPLGSADIGLSLRAAAYRTESTLPRLITVILIIGLTLVVAGSLWALRSHVTRRVRVEKERDRLFNLSLDILCIADADGVFRRVNPAFARVLDHATPDVIGRRLTDFVHEDDLKLTQDALHRLRLGQPASFESRCRCANDEYKWLVWSVNPVPEERLLYAVAHDITDRKDAETALRAEYAFRKAMEESVVVGLRAIDLTGRITYVNPGYCQMVGHSATDLVGVLPPYPYWPPADREIMEQNLELTLSGKAPRSGFEMRVQRADGECIDVRLYVSPLIDSTGQQTGWMAAMHDITEPKRARAELEAAHERFVAVLDGLDAAVHVIDARSDEILYANRAFCSIFGFDAVGADGWQRTAHCHPGRAALLCDPHLLALADLPRELYDGEIRNSLTGRWCHLRERAIKWVDGRVVRMVVATDITDRKQVDEENLRQQTRLEQTSRLITMGEMASSLAHELNQPLAAIANYCSGSVKRLAGGGASNDELLGAMQKASVQAERAGKIVRRVRDFVKKNEPQRTSCTLQEIVDEAMGFADIPARNSGVRLTTEIASDLPPVFADRIMIEQVLLNLLKNAIEAMQATAPKDRVVVLSARAEGDGTVAVTVADRGCGIAPDAAGQLFSPFYTTKQEGMGMGLNICRSIIELHEGRLTVESNSGSGSVFRFTLPIGEL
jgi:PAS domain S-box-containing protein